MTGNVGVEVAWCWAILSCANIDICHQALRHQKEGSGILIENLAFWMCSIKTQTKHIRQTGCRARKFSQCQLFASRQRRPHTRVHGCWPWAPFGDGFYVQPVAGRKLAIRLFRRLELGSNSRRCSGWTMKTSVHNASSCSIAKDAPWVSETEHLGSRGVEFVNNSGRIINYNGRLPRWSVTACLRQMHKLVWWNCDRRYILMCQDSPFGNF